jgi:hypothetical protein
MHEAGHAVAVVALGARVNQVSVRRAGITGGRCWHDLGELAPMDEAIVCLAGPCAELFTAEGEPDAYHRAAVFVGADPDDHIGGDWPTARALADAHGFSHDDAVDRSAVLVLEHWPAIEAVARALRGSRRGIVSGERVAEIVACTPRRRGLTLA